MALLIIPTTHQKGPSLPRPPHILFKPGTWLPFCEASESLLQLSLLIWHWKMSPYPMIVFNCWGLQDFTEGAEWSWCNFLHGLCQRSRAGGKLQVSSMVSKLLLVPPGLPEQDLFANNSFQILPGFLVSICVIALKQILLGGEWHAGAIFLFSCLFISLCSH